MADEGLTTKSMYSELLAMSLAFVDASTTQRANERRLLGQLATHQELRDTRRSSVTSQAVGASARIATELEYDNALVRLCRLHGIPYDVARFTRPLSERRRLEEALEAAGVKVHARGRDDRRGERSAAHEPPEGS